MTTHVSPDEARLYYKAQLNAHIEDIIGQISLRPDDSPMHNVEAYHDGLRVPIDMHGGLTWYVYCLPWARGWSIFVSPLASDVASFSWRTVPVRFKSLQVPVYCPRDKVGPWQAPAVQIVAAFEYLVRRVQATKTHRRRALEGAR